MYLMTFSKRAVRICALCVCAAGIAWAAEAPGIADKEAFQRAIEAYEQGDLDQARIILSRLDEQEPENPAILNNLAAVAVRQKRYDDAIALLKRAIASNQEINTSYQNLSRIHAHKAALAYRKALSLEDQKTQEPDLHLVGKSYDPPADEETVAEALLNAEEIDKSLVHKYDTAVTENGDQEQAVIAAVRKWALAWAAQDLDEYIGSYLKNYYPFTMDSHQSWKQLRTQRLSAPRYIKVRVNDFSVSITDNIAARVVFTQTYESNLLSSITRKELEMLRLNTKWKIIDERTLR